MPALKKQTFVLLLVFLHGISCSQAPPIPCDETQFIECLPEAGVIAEAAQNATPLPECGLPDTFLDLGAAETNLEIRQWYVDVVDTIPELNRRWIEEGLPLEKRAVCAYQLRRLARVRAREAMSEPHEVKLLEARDRNKYGDPLGPTFCWLVVQKCADGLAGADIYQAIIDSSTKTNPAFNRGVKHKTHKTNGP
ncbi:hypothetical protein SCOR_10525 [Sulfidibacter corallicola]|uniref:DUF1311 domain-containing protein n=1 Tax=Sulfidibacter corallicola TaxID=2818388 RepID=A0A8A4TFB0_SULCO|nr:hypothetical protein [Sulfidibacter corallicola]QTD48230.1 hypothetical protein J3U87_21810 [Sulfidibacter corallicola]